MMRPHFLSAAFGIVLASTACTRPVLYYPDPVPAAETPPIKPVATSRPGRSGGGGTATPEFPDATVAVVGGSGSSASDAAYLLSRRILVPVMGADMSKVRIPSTTPAGPAGVATQAVSLWPHHDHARDSPQRNQLLDRLMDRPILADAD